MTLDTTEQGTKERILTAAAAEFASKGFDGARVDDIAKRAGVNKALIYYYYKSKEELLEILFRSISEEIISSEAMRVMKTMSGADFIDKTALFSLMNMFLDTLEARQDVIRLALMELAKRTPINTMIFSIFEEIMEQMFSIPIAAEMRKPENKSHSMITEFFTGILPMLDYVAYHEIWMERFGIDETSLRASFIESFLGTHFAYTIHGYSKGEG